MKYTMLIALTIFAVLMAGCTSPSPYNAAHPIGSAKTNESIIPFEAVDAIGNSWYMKEHNTSLDTSSVRLLSPPNGYAGADMAIRFKTTDGRIHTTNLSISTRYNAVYIHNIDGEIMGYVGENEYTIPENVITAIGTTWYLKDHTTSLVDLDIRPTYMLSIGNGEYVITYQYNSTDGKTHTSNVFLSNNSSSVIVLDVDGAFAGNVFNEFSPYVSYKAVSAIGYSWYMEEHDTSLNISSVRLMNWTNREQWSDHTYQFTTTDGKLHTGNMTFMYNGTVILRDIDNETMSKA